MAKKTVRDLLVHVGKNPKLVDELVSKKSRDERIAVLKSHKIIDSAADLPTKEEAQKELTQLFAPAQGQQDLLKGVQAASAFIAWGGSYDE